MKKELVKAVTVTMTGVVAATSTVGATPVVAMAQDTEPGMERNVEEPENDPDGDISGEIVEDPSPVEELDAGVLCEVGNEPLVVLDGVGYSTGITISLSATSLVEGAKVSRVELIAVDGDERKSIVLTETSELVSVITDYTGKLEARVHFVNEATGEDLGFIDKDLTGSLGSLESISRYVLDSRGVEISDISVSDGLYSVPTVSGGVALVGDGVIRVSLSDAGVGIVDPESVVVSGIPVENYEYSDGVLTIRTTGLSEGVLGFTVSGADLLGNVSSRDFNELLYRTPAVVGLESYSLDGCYTAGGVTYFGNSSDSLSLKFTGYDDPRVMNMSFVANGVIAPVDMASGSVSIDLGTGISNAHINVTDIFGAVTSIDLEDLTAGAVANDLVLDSDNPTIGDVDESTAGVVTSGSTRYITNSSGFIRLPVSDATSGISSAVVKFGDVEVEGCTLDSGVLSIPVASLPSERGVLSVSVYDGVGNTSSWNSEYVCLPETPTMSEIQVWGATYWVDTYYAGSEGVNIRVGATPEGVVSVRLVSEDGDVEYPVVNGSATITESGNYHIEVEDVAGRIRSVDLAELGLNTNRFVMDMEGPVISDGVSDVEPIEIEGAIYYTSDGLIQYSVEDLISTAYASTVTVSLDSSAYTVSSDGVSVTGIVVDTSALPEGETTFEISVKDCVGNMSSRTFSLYMYRSDSSISVESVSGNYVTRDGVSYFNSSVDLGFSIGSPEKVLDLSIENADTGESTPITDDLRFSIKASGNYIVKVKNLLGEVSEYRLEDLYEGLSSDMVLDVTAPSVISKDFSGESETVDSGTYFTSDGVLSIQVSDLGAGVSVDTWEVLGVNSSYVSISEDGLTVGVDTAGLPEGASEISLYVEDALGNTLRDTTSVYMYRNPAEITGSTHGWAINKDSQSYVMGTISINLAGFNSETVSSVKLLKDGVVVQNIENGVFSIDSSGEYTVQLTDLIGDVTVYRMEDLFSDGFCSNIVIDVDGPEVVDRSFSGTTEVRDGIAYYTSDGLLSLEIKDTGVGLGSDFFQVTGVSSEAVSYDDSIVSIDTKYLPEGESSLSYVIKDELGNRRMGSLSLYMFRTAPTLSGIGVSGNYVSDVQKGETYFNGSLQLSYSCSDLLKVVSVELRNGEELEGVSGGLFTIEGSGDYSLVLTDLLGNVTEYPLQSLYSGLYSKVYLDVDAPYVSNESFSGDSINVGDQAYLTSDGVYAIELSDVLSGVDVDSWKISGVGSNSYSVDGSRLSIDSSTLPEGTSTVSYQVSDRLGNVYSGSVSLFMHRVFPEITGISCTTVNLVDGVSYLNGPIEFTLGGWDSYKIHSIELYRDGELVDSVDQGTFRISSSGEYVVRVTDLVNNARVYRLENLFSGLTSRVVIDTVLPSVVARVNGSAVDSGVWITGNAGLTVDVADEVGMRSATVNINGVEIVRGYSILDKDQFSFDLSSDVPRSADGRYVIRVSVTDVAGNTYNADPVIVLADFDAPTFSDLSISGLRVDEGDAVYFSGELTVTGSTDDIGSGVEKVELLRGNNVVSTGLPVRISDSGEYSIRVTDRAGLSTTVSLSSVLGTSSNTLIADNTSPAVSRVEGFTGDLVDGGTIWYGDAPVLVYNVSDTNLRHVSISINGNVVVNSLSSDNIYKIDTSGYEGSVQVDVVAVDVVGNRSEDRFQYMADFTAPTFNSASLNTGYVEKDGRVFFRSNPVLSVSAVDAGVGVSEYRLSDGNTSSGEFTLGTSEYSVEVVDRLGHSSGMIPVGQLLGLSSSVFVVDTKIPSISVDRTDPVFDNWFGGDVEYTVRLSDDIGINNAEVYINNVLVASSSVVSGYDTEEVLSASTSSVPVSENGRYEIRIIVKDNAGNSSEWSEAIYIDREVPSVDRFVFTGDGSVEGVESGGSNRFGFFFNGGASCEIHVSDGSVSSGLTKAVVTLESVGGGSTVLEAPIVRGIARVEVPSNFKGFVSAYAVDAVGHAGSENRPDGIVTEDSNYHINSLSLDIRMPETGYTDVAGNMLYGSDASAEATIGCGMSGIRSIEWGISGTTLGSIEISSDGVVSGDSASIVSSDRNLVLSLDRVLSLQGNANGLEIWVRVADRTGHVSETSRVFSIDKDAPQIMVSYDTVEDDTYYAVNRVARITVEERNFDPSRFVVEGQYGTLGSWTNEGNIWYNTLTFSEDGDYQYSLRCTDRAGNASNVYNSDSFTIDKTSPELSVSWNDVSPDNENYYNATRVATITVVEHNFDASRFALTGDGVLSGWSSSGDVHTARVEFGYDGQYQFSITGTDLAGNPSTVYESGIFNIDVSMPQLSIIGVEQGVSYKDDVSFRIQMSDNQIDMSRTSVSLMGRKNGSIRVTGTLNTQTGEYEYNNFPREELYDDVYTLRAVVVDMAGNTAEQEIVFSVNRFGSSYSALDPSILGTYLSEPQDIVITEMNVDRLNIDAARVVVIKDGADYPVSSSLIHITESESDGYYVYTYIVDKEAFSEDGAYLVQIYSQAEEGTDYNSLSQEYAFVLDSTPPEIIVSGVESDKTYRDYERVATIDVRDLSGVDSITVTLNGQNVPLNRSNGLYSFSVFESNDSQSFTVTVTDKAGNSSTMEVGGFVLTTASTVYIVNQPWFKWGIGLLLAFLAAIIALIAKNRRAAKKDEEELSKTYSELYKTSSSASSSSSTASTGGKDVVGDLDSTEEASTELMDEGLDESAVTENPEESNDTIEKK